MKILNFDEFTVNEGFINKTLKRVRTGEERIEDKITTNIDEFSEIDLGFPFVFADRVLEVDGKDMMTNLELMSYMKTINKKNTGWRLLTRDDIYNNFLTEKKLLKNNFYTQYIFKGNKQQRAVAHVLFGNSEIKNTGELVLEIGNYWMEGESDDSFADVWRIRDSRMWKDSCMSVKVMNVEEYHKVIMVKDKK